MAKNNTVKVKEVETLNNEVLKEEVQSKMAAAPEEEETKVSFGEKHPKLAAFGSKAKKIGKWVGVGAAAVGGIVIASKVGEAKGFNKAMDAMNNASGGTDVPETIPEEIPQVEEEIPQDDVVTTTEF